MSNMTKITFPITKMYTMNPGGQRLLLLQGTFKMWIVSRWNEGVESKGGVNGWSQRMKSDILYYKQNDIAIESWRNNSCPTVTAVTHTQMR